MYWLFNEDEKESLREDLQRLVDSIPEGTGADHNLQLFHFVGRKDLNQARAVVDVLSSPGDTVLDPFMGSGIFGMAACLEGRDFVGNEWEPYTYRQASSLWREYNRSSVIDGLHKIHEDVKSEEKFLYWSRCSCGNDVVIESLFFDLEPLEYRDVTKHERLQQPNGENVVFRGRLKCANCHRKAKFFDDDDQNHLEEIARRALPDWGSDLFSRKLIENSRINLSAKWTDYGKLFPHRSKLALCYIWESMHSLDLEASVLDFLEDVFFTVIQLAKYKDYRSKSQDIHPPKIQLRESNVFEAFRAQAMKRLRRLDATSLSGYQENTTLTSMDFRQRLSTLEAESVDLVVTDPPWNDGNAYFEKAQLYHPWMDYDLSLDAGRLEGEVVVTDAPSRRSVHNEDRWWRDMEEMFVSSYRVLKTGRFFAMYFRPIKAADWVSNLNTIKLIARRAGFEPLLSVDVSSKDPSMRKQQSASFSFSKDMIFVFVKLPREVTRYFIGDVDVDYLAFKSCVNAAARNDGSYTWSDWREEFKSICLSESCSSIFTQKYFDVPSALFKRYSRSNEHGRYICRNDTPYDALLFDVPIEERLFAFVPEVISALSEKSRIFTFADFLLGLATYVENGTRSLIGKVSEVNLKSIMAPYVEEVSPGMFSVRSKPRLPEVTASLMDLDPLDFENFTAELFRRLGYRSVAVVGGSGDRGVDVMAIDDEGHSVVIQCKRYLHPVGSQPIQRLHSFAVTRGVDRTIVVTTSSFSLQALDEADNTGTELIDGDDLSLLVPDCFPEWESFGS